MSLWLRDHTTMSVFASYHPYYILLAAGCLDPEIFEEFVSQQMIFMNCFVDTFEIAELLCDDQLRDVFHDTRSYLFEEREMCRKALEELNVNLAKKTVATPTIANYSKFIRGAAVGIADHENGSQQVEIYSEKKLCTAFTLSVMCPHIRLNAFLGKCFESMFPRASEDHPFKKWMDFYSNGKFEVIADQMEAMLHQITELLSDNDLEIVSRLYHKALNYEVDILTDLSVFQPPSVPLVKLHDPVHIYLACNFDLTCTTRDSAAVLVNVAMLKALGDSSIESGGCNDLVLEAIISYRAEYHQLVESLCSAEADFVASRDLPYVLVRISEIDKRVKSKVIESGILCGIKIEDIQKVGESLVLQTGCTDFFHKVKGEENQINAETHLISYCWFDDIIKSSVSSGCLNNLTIHSNTMNYETGEWCLKMETPTDKLETFKSILRGSDSRKSLSVYVGSSVSDLLCLTNANIGIVFGPSKTLRMLAKLCGITFIPLLSGSVRQQRRIMDGSHAWKDTSGVLYTVSSWAEISAFVLGR